MVRNCRDWVEDQLLGRRGKGMVRLMEGWFWMLMGFWRMWLLMVDWFDWMVWFMVYRFNRRQINIVGKL